MVFSKAEGAPGAPPPPGAPPGTAFDLEPDSWLRSGVSVVLGRGVDGALRFALFLATARVLAPADFNLYALLTAALGTSQRLVSFASPRVAMYFQAKRDRGPLIAWLSLAAAGGAGIIFAALAIGALRRAMFPGVPSATLWLGLSPLPFLLVADSFSAMLLAAGREKLYALSLWSRTIGLAAVLVASFAAADRLSWLLWGRLAVAAAVAGFVAAAVQAVPSARGLGAMSREAAAYAFPASIASGLGALHRRADVFLLAALGRGSEIGGYAICYALAEAFWVLTDSLEASLFVRLSRSETADAAALTREAWRRYRVVGLVAGAIGLAAGEAVLLLGFRDRFPASPRIFPVVLAGVVAWGITRPFASFLYSRGRTGGMLALQLGGLLVNLAGCAALIPRFGALGAAASSAASYTLQGLAGAWLFGRHPTLDPETA